MSRRWPPSPPILLPEGWRALRANGLFGLLGRIGEAWAQLRPSVKTPNARMKAISPARKTKAFPLCLAPRRPPRSCPLEATPPVSAEDCAAVIRPTAMPVPQDHAPMQGAARSLPSAPDRFSTADCHDGFCGFPGFRADVENRLNGEATHY